MLAILLHLKPLLPRYLRGGNSEGDRSNFTSQKLAILYITASKNLCKSVLEEQDVTEVQVHGITSSR